MPADKWAPRYLNTVAKVGIGKLAFQLPQGQAFCHITENEAKFFRKSFIGLDSFDRKE